MAVKAGSIYPTPGVSRSFTAPAGSQFTSVFVDGTGADAQVNVFLGQAAEAEPLRTVAPGGSATFAVPACSAVTFQISSSALPPAEGDQIYWGASTDPMSGTSTATRIIATIANAVLQIQGNVQATIANASIAVNQAANAVFQIAGSVTVANASIAVTQAANAIFQIAGSVSATITNSVINVSGAVQATITNATLNVQQAASAVFQVAGSVNATVTNSVLSIQQAAGAVFQVNGTVQATFPAAQDVLLAGTGPVEVQNLLLSNNNLVFLYELSGTIASFAAGASISSGGDGLSGVTFAVGQSQIGLFDGYFVLLRSARATYTQGSVGQLGINNGGAMQDFNSYQVFGAGTTIGDANPQNNGVAGYGMIGPILLGSPLPFNLVKHNVTNNTGSAVLDDTLTFWVFGIKAQMSNTSATPGVIQQNEGSYGSLAGTNGGGIGSGSVSIIAAGGYWAGFQFGGASIQFGAYSSPVSLAIELWMGGQMLDSFSTTSSTTQPTTLTLADKAYSFGGAPVPNPGVSIVCLVNGAQAAPISGAYYASYGTVVNGTPPLRPISVV